MVIPAIRLPLSRRKMNNNKMPSTQLRKTVLASARRVVVKLGTQVLTGEDGQLDLPFLKSVAAQIAHLRDRLQVTVVSSGAIGAGCATLGLAKRPRGVAQLQAIAAVGQHGLMSHMHQAFGPLGLNVAQVLLTRGDFDDRVRYLNIRNCVTQLHKMGCVPVVNENDTVAVEELRFGDNDLLAAMMCHALRADALVLLTTVDGLLDTSGQRVDLVTDPNAARALTRPETSERGVGGMSAKLDAASLVTESGEIAVIAKGREPDVLTRLFDSEPLGTVFVPAKRKLDSRQRWIGLTKRPSGTITVDPGAAHALEQQGKSLLATGITATAGDYDRGDAVQINDAAGRTIARGLTNYSASEVSEIMGRRSSQLEKILGRVAYSEVVHRDNLILITP